MNKKVLLGASALSFVVLSSVILLNQSEKSPSVFPSDFENEAAFINAPIEEAPHIGIESKANVEKVEIQVKKKSIEAVKVSKKHSTKVSDVTASKLINESKSDSIITSVTEEELNAVILSSSNNSEEVLKNKKEDKFSYNGLTEQKNEKVANDKWIQHLSGKSAKLDIVNVKKRELDCRVEMNECEKIEKRKDISVAGIVFQNGSGEDSDFSGEIAQGNFVAGTPAIYLK